MTRTLKARWLGRQRYVPVLELQRRLFVERQAGAGEDIVLFVEHEPVITLGRGAKSSHLLASTDHLKKLGVDLVEVERGGDITLHAPGQLVCYPIVSLPPDRRDVRHYVNNLAEAMRGVIRPFELDAGLVTGKVGLWLDSTNPTHWRGPENAITLAKIGAIGVRLSRWVTMHGYALNLSTDLQLFNLIVPCGISEYPVTSVQALTGQPVSVESVVPRAYEQLCRILDAKPVGLSDESGRRLE
jgi:lipoyl(octanoyl) transferase